MGAEGNWVWGGDPSVRPRPGLGRLQQIGRWKAEVIADALILWRGIQLARAGDAFAHAKQG